MACVKALGKSKMALNRKVRAGSMIMMLDMKDARDASFPRRLPIPPFEIACVV